LCYILTVNTTLKIKSLKLFLKYICCKVSTIGSAAVLSMLALTLNTNCNAQAPKDQFILDMVHNNPGEKLTKSDFNSPSYLQMNGYNGQVINDFTFVHTAITYDALGQDIFPIGSTERKWVMDAADKVRVNIDKAHAAGIKVYYFTDIIVLPKKLVSIYKNEICDANGKISFEKPKTQELHRIMLKEVFDSFPGLDGLVIRTGETYLNNVPYHTGNGPIINGAESHVKLINILKEEVCVKRNKIVFYRTWSFGGMHDNANYYLDVTNRIEPHKNLIFSIKHTKGDYQRTYNFNPTLGLGNHPQIIEVQCQREYEGKGAYPNYVMDGVINGFEEFNTNTPQSGNKSLNDIKHKPTFKGVWSWSRGGGWVGPYITNEFWCKLNAYVIGTWAANTTLTEEEVFNKFMDVNGIKGSSRKAFRQLCLLSAKAVLRGHTSATLPFQVDWAFWMRDEFLSGIGSKPSVKTNTSEGWLKNAFTYYDANGQLQQAIDEKYEAVEQWKTIVSLSSRIKLTNKNDENYIRISSQYGLLLHQIIAEGWKIMALGFEGDKHKKYDTLQLTKAIKLYDNYWQAYNQLKANNPSCATLYKPYAFVYESPLYHRDFGMKASIDKYRLILNQQQ
jgi:hypothetical protein